MILQVQGIRKFFEELCGEYKLGFFKKTDIISASTATLGL